jgi:release factor glutamine methyltransferase
MELPQDNQISSVMQRYHDLLDEKLGGPEVNAIFALLVWYYLGWDRTRLHSEPTSKISESELLKFHFALKELLKDKPVQYIIGETEFCDLRILVNEGVLIPRPETEELAYLVRDLCREKNRSPGIVIDFCTGSGCLALALQKFFPAAKVFGTDISPAAIKTAESNAALNHLPVDFFISDLLASSETEILELLNISPAQTDLIVSNPPYILRSEASSMSHNVLDYEPHIALFADGNDPLVFYRRIAALSLKLLRKGGLFAVEMNEFKGDETCKVFSDSGFHNVSIVHDMQNKKRFVTGNR